MAPLVLRLSGIAALLASDGAQAVLDRHGALLAARLALLGPQPRGALAALLWPDLAPERARANLRQRLLRLRALAPTPWITGAAVLRLAPQVTVLPWQDRALGEWLQGVDAPESPVLAAWLDQVRAQRLQDRAVQWQHDIDEAEADGRMDEALALAQRWLAVDALAEAPYRSLARLHYLQHDTARAAVVLQRLATMLQTEFGARPSASTTALLRAVQAAQAAPAHDGAGGVRLSGPARPPACLLHPPVLVGRDEALALLARQWQAGGLVWVSGAPGMGTSRVLAAGLAAPSAGLATWPVLRVAARPADADAPWATLQRWRDAWRALAAEVGLNPVPDEAWRFTEVLPADEPATLPARWRAGLAALAAALDRSGVVGVVVDQLHDAHPSSQLALLALAEASALPWCLGGRPGLARGAVGDSLRRLQGARRLLHLPLAPLGPDAVHQLLCTLAGPAGWGRVDDGVGRALHGHAGGNPWHLLSTLVQAGQALGVGPWPRPAQVVAALAALCQALPPSARQLAQLLAVADRRAGPAAVASVLGRTVLDLADDWQALEAAHLVQGTTVAHDLAREALLQTLPAALAAELHRALATRLEQALDGHQIEAAHLAWHWQAAGRPGQALPWWLQAADQAHAELRPQEEARHLAQAVAAVEALDPPQALVLLLRLARVQADAHGLGASLPSLEQALRLAGDGPERVTVLKLLAEAQLNCLMPEASARSAEQALQLATVPSPEAAELVVRLHKALCLAGQAAQAQRQWQQHRAWLVPERLPSAELVSDRAWVLDRLARVREADRWHQAALDRALADGRPVDEAVVLGNWAQGLVLAGRPQRAIQALDRAAAAAARHQGLHQASNYNHLGRASAEHLCGHYAAALAGYQNALAAAAAQSPQAMLTIQLRRAGLWADIGQPARALADLAPVLASRRLPAWTRGRAQALAIRLSPQPVRARVQDLQALLAALDDAAQVAFDAPLRLQCAAWMGPGAEAEPAWRLARQVLRQARCGGHPGLRWAAHWAAAQAALAAGRPLTARRHAGACAARPAGEVAIDLPDGLWWFGLWRVWLALGEPVRADAARRAGQAWLAHTAQHHVLPEHQASFINAVPAHRALWADPAA